MSELKKHQNPTQRGNNGSRLLLRLSFYKNYSYLKKLRREILKNFIAEPGDFIRDKFIEDAKKTAKNRIRTAKNVR